MSTTSFQAVLEKALDDYRKQTGVKLDKHPFADKLRTGDSSDHVLNLLKDKVDEFKDGRDGDRKLINRLNPVVNVIRTLSESLGPATGLFPPANLIFAGMGVLIAAGVSSSYDELVGLFERIGNFLERLRIYTNIPLSPSMTDVIGKIIVELLSVLALATKYIKQGRFKKFTRKLLGVSEIEDALQRLDRLTQEENRVAAAQTLEVVYGIVNNMKAVTDVGRTSSDGMQGALDIMQDLAKQRQDAETILETRAEVLRQQAETAKREVEVTKREIAVERAEQEVRLKERDARRKEEELLLKEDVLRKEQEALRMEEDARRTVLVERWRVEQPLSHEEGRGAAEVGMGTKDLVVSAWDQLKGWIGWDPQINKQNAARIPQDQDQDKFDGNGIGVGSVSPANANTDPGTSTRPPVQIPRHVVEQRRSTSEISAMPDMGNMAISGEDQEEHGSVSRAVTSERGTSTEASAEYTVRSINSYKEKLHRSPDYLRHVTRE